MDDADRDAQVESIWAERNVREDAANAARLASWRKKMLGFRHAAVSSTKLSLANVPAAGS